MCEFGGIILPKHIIGRISVVGKAENACRLLVRWLVYRCGANELHFRERLYWDLRPLAALLLKSHANKHVYRI